MAVSADLPLQERVPLKNNIKRASELAILFLLIAHLLCCRLRRHGPAAAWHAAFLCESWFAFLWLLCMNANWNPVKYITYPDRISKRFDDLPAVDMFVTTADPKLEPPLVTVNTVLSLLAVEYPAHKLACYVSDDGCSAVTYYALVEAAEFARSWVPFCKEYDIRVRAPSVYFSGEAETRPHLLSTTTAGFLHDWQLMKDKYEELERRIEEASSRSDHPPSHHAVLLKDELAAAHLSKFDRRNHPSIVKVIWENEDELSTHGIPHLIYVSREKRPKHPHHYKAGAMNVLTRVSGVMTNAPVMLNVDCDMFVNNPDAVLHAMCLLIGFADGDRTSGFVQCPQRFYGGLKDDPFGNQLVVLQHTVTTGAGGLQGPFYQGTGCFHRRKVIYGEAPAALDQNHSSGSTKSREDQKGTTVPSPQELQTRFGSSKELQESAAEIIIAISIPTEPSDVKGLTAREAAAKQVASCTYELNTCWGNEVGWVYGSLAEDIQTGLRIHSLGWKSVALETNPPAFLGSTPVGGPDSMIQYKRWCTGLLENVVGRHSPLPATLTKNLSFRQCLVYLLINTWGLRSVPELCYALLAPFCVFSNTSFLPKASEPLMFVILVLLFVSYNVYTLVEYIVCGLSVRAWWNNQRMQRIRWTSASLFGLLCVVAKVLGISQTTFEITAKEQTNTSTGSDAEEDPGRFTFDSSPLFIPGTVIVLLNSAALVVGSSEVIMGSVLSGMNCSRETGIGELVCSALVVLLFWPFLKGLFGKGRYGIPWLTIAVGSALSSLFLLFCKLWTCLFSQA